MPDVTVKLSDGIREVAVEMTGDDALDKAEAAAVRLYSVVTAASPPGQRTGFAGWALASDTERGHEE